ncbi:transmembrane protein 161B [Onthophagus taurus]|uniref:transmembrane protein 161B n=1 Tax=Onthophagus taurus TaxID=166361 RepID=UPI000C20B51A|nr:transmembrane protein 161B isoform X1 [Onthophagus taurus]XP_022909493.1 transmembrane protein 161B isoform X2 [Onthophagus taurus]
MALLGAQLVITLIMISIIQKLGPYFSFAKFLLCSTGLVRYLYPTDDELKEVANIPKDKHKNRKGKQQNGKVDSFHIPRSLEIDLKTAKVTQLDVIHLRFYAEYQWLVDFAIYSCLVYVITEIYQNFFSLKDEMNLSMMWCTLVLIFAIKLLFSLTVQYFKADESVGERSTCLVMGFVYLLIAMMILIVDENILEIGLQTAYKSFNDSASTFLNQQGLNSSGPASKIIIQFFLAIFGALLGAVFTFPGLRIARMHWDLLKLHRKNKTIQTLLNLSFALPFLLVVAWIKPFSRHYLTVRIFSGMTSPLLSNDSFEILRLIFIILTVIIKIVLMPVYLQAYLDMAYHRLEEQKKEAGRITNIDLQKKIAAVFYYLCVVTLQYIAPLILIIYFAFMYKTLGGFSWNGLLGNQNLEECPANSFEQTNLEGEDNIQNSAHQFHLAIENLKNVFTPQVFKGLFGFGTWWSCFLYFTTTSIGMIYQSYFTQS